jgi:Holliday junction resolvase RusA-like endonuclease
MDGQGSPSLLPARRTFPAKSGAVASTPQPALKSFQGGPVAPIFLRVPTPPSVNRAYRNTPRGRAKTSEYDNWLLTAYQMIKASGCAANHGRVGILLGIEREPKMNRADLDNRCKLLLDALVSACVILDDKYVTFLAMCWLPPANGLSHVHIFSASDMPMLMAHASSDGATGAWEIQHHHTNEGEPDGLYV